MTIATAEKDALAVGLGYIETHPGDWDQNDWSACLAHWTVVNHSEVSTVLNSMTGPIVIHNDGHLTPLGRWLEERYSGMEALWSAARTMDELHAGVQAALDDRDVDDAITNALLDRVARNQAVRAARALDGYMEDVLVNG